MSDLPGGWAWSTVGDVTVSVESHDPHGSPEVEFEYIDIGGIDGDRLRIESTKRYRGVDAPSRARQIVLSGDIVLSTVRTNLRKTAPVPPSLDGATASTGFSVLRSTGAMVPELLFHQVTHQPFIDSLSERQTGSSYPAVRDRDVRAMSVVVPPLPEQRRIVSAIEEHLSRLDVAEVALDAAEKRCVALLQAQREHELSGDSPVRPIEAIASSTKYSLAIGPFGSDLKVSDYRDTGVPLVFVRDIRRRAFGGVGTRFVEPMKAAALSAHRVRSGDVLVTKMGDPPGDVALYSGPDAIITADCIKISPAPDVDAGYLVEALQTSAVARQIESITRGVAQRKVSLGRFRKEVVVPIPQLAHQREIFERVADVGEEVGGLVTEIRRARQRANALRRSILAAAFSGQLVPQDPSDEPASELLAGIAAERTANETRKRKTSS